MSGNLKQSCMRVIVSLLALCGLRIARTASSNIRTVQKASARDCKERHFTQTRYARLFGPLNSDLGMVYYALVAFCATTGLTRAPLVRAALRGISASTVMMSLYLLWALQFRLRVRCAVCIKGHLVNILLMLALWRGDREHPG